MATSTETNRTAEPRRRGRQAFVQGVHGVRYQVTDVARSVAFYTTHLGFTLTHQQLPAFASVSLGDAQILLSGPEASGSRPMPDGQRQTPGGWNRVVLAHLRSARVHRRFEKRGPPVSERHGDRPWRQANPSRGSRRESDRVVRTGAMTARSRKEADDSPAQVREVPLLLTEARPADWPPAQPGHVFHSGGSREARARRPVLQAPGVTLRRVAIRPALHARCRGGRGGGIGSVGGGSGDGSGTGAGRGDGTGSGSSSAGGSVGCGCGTGVMGTLLVAPMHD